MEASPTDDYGILGKGVVVAVTPTPKKRRVISNNDDDWNISRRGVPTQPGTQSEGDELVDSSESGNERDSKRKSKNISNEDSCYYEDEVNTYESEMASFEDIDPDAVAGQYGCLITGEILKGSLGVIYLETNNGEDAFVHHLHLEVMGKSVFAKTHGFICTAHLSKGRNSEDKKFNKEAVKKGNLAGQLMPKRVVVFRMTRPTPNKLYSMLQNIKVVSSIVKAIKMHVG